MQLRNKEGSCSGEQIHAPSGADYILSAAHCKLIMDKDGNMPIITAEGAKIQRRVIAINETSDLMLIEGVPGLRGLDIAASSYPTESIRTFTHGRAMQTYKTEGVVIEDAEVPILVGIITDVESEAKCKENPTNKVVTTPFFGFCVAYRTYTVTNAMVVPGSSGGAVVDSAGDLMGVVSAGGDGFGYLVRLSDIKSFLSGY